MQSDPLANDILIYDAFGERYGWTPDYIDMLNVDIVDLLIATIEVKNKRMEAEQKGARARR